MIDLSRDALTSGKESLKSPGKHESTCANVEKAQVRHLGSRSAGLDLGSIGHDRCYCKRQSKGESCCQTHRIAGPSACAPWITREGRRTTTRSKVMDHV